MPTRNVHVLRTRADAWLYLRAKAYRLSSHLPGMTCAREEEDIAEHRAGACRAWYTVEDEYEEMLPLLAGIYGV